MSEDIFNAKYTERKVNYEEKIKFIYGSSAFIKYKRNGCPKL